MVSFFNAVLEALNLEAAFTQGCFGVTYLVYKRDADNLHCEGLQQQIIPSTLTPRVQGQGILWMKQAFQKYLSFIGKESRLSQENYARGVHTSLAQHLLLLLALVKS